MWSQGDRHCADGECEIDEATQSEVPEPELSSRSWAHRAPARALSQGPPGDSCPQSLAQSLPHTHPLLRAKGRQDRNSHQLGLSQSMSSEVGGPPTRALEASSVWVPPAP